MAAEITSMISRRNLLRLGAFAGVAAAFAPVLPLDFAQAQEVCNGSRPAIPATALQALIDGNAMWAAGTQTYPGQDTARRDCVATNAQTPFASILSCSDSRVPPELLFDQGLGDLFVARVAGNTARGKLLESLLYGQSNLGTPLLFVMGHSNCGAVTTAVQSYPHHQLEFINLIFPAVKRARKIVKQNGGDPTDPAQVIPVATDQNVLIVADALRKYFKKAIGDGSAFNIAGGRYDLDTQVVTILSPLA